MTASASAPGDEAQAAVYERVCESYLAVDDFRMKLLGLLPVATGTGVFLLLNGNAESLGDRDSGVDTALMAIGAFGVLFTLGLFAFELFGIKKCHHLIATGQQLERDMELVGQFLSRPEALGGFINEPYASGIIYPASLAAWVFLALAGVSEPAAALAAVLTFVAGYAGTRFAARKIAEASPFGRG
jgi:hypothetical protein